MKSRIKYWLGFALIFNTLLTGGQEFLNKDSLLRLLVNAPDDTDKVSLYISIGQQYENNVPDSAAFFYLKSRDLSNKLNYPRGILKFISNYTYVLNMQGKLDSSLILNLEAVKIAEASGDKHLIATALGNAGSTYLFMSQYEKSIEYYLKSSLLFEQLNNKRYLSILYSNLCNLYGKVHQSDKAVFYGEKSILLSKEMNDLVNLGNAYCNTGGELINQKKIQKGMDYLENALKISEEINNKYLKQSTLLHISNAYMKQYQYDKIKPYLEESYQLSILLEDHEGLAISLRGLGEYYYHQSRFTKAGQYAKSSLELSRKQHDRLNESKALMLLANIAGSMHLLNSQARYYNMHDSVENEILNDEVTQNMQELETKYEAEKKLQQIQQLEKDKQLQSVIIRQKNNLNLGFLFSIIIILMMSILIYRNHKQKRIIDQQRISELEKEKQILVTEALIKGQEDERRRLARDLHDGLGGLLTGIKYSLTDIKGNKVVSGENILSFQRTIDMLDSSINELRRIALNMMPEALIRFGLDSALRDFCTDINNSGTLKIVYQSIGFSESTLDQTLGITLYRIVQELITNIMKHAVANQALIQIQQVDSRLMITAEDNGKGFDVSETDKKPGMGWKNIRSRVEYLRGTIDLQSAPGTGTSVNIEIEI